MTYALTLVMYVLYVFGDGCSSCTCSSLEHMSIYCAVISMCSHVRYMSSSVRLSVCLSVCLSSVTLVHPTQTIKIFGNVFTPVGTLDIC